MSNNQMTMNRLTANLQMPAECISRLNAMAPRQMAQRGFVRKSDLDLGFTPVLEIIDIY